MLVFSNFGKGPIGGYFYVSDGANVLTMDDVLVFPKIPAGNGECFEMRPSKATFRLRNLTPNLNKVTSCTVLVTAQRPKVSNYIYDGNGRTTAQNNVDYEEMWNQLYSRPEAKAYAYSTGRELCLLPVDMVDYQSYKAPTTMTYEDLAKSTQSQANAATAKTDVPMQIAYMLFPKIAAVQTIELDAYITVRARYDMDSPMSVMATGEFVPTKREEQLMQAVLSAVHNETTVVEPAGAK